jgi:2-oxo-4-hydroxy-4-carboxy-5-ureidoimidazoline decarboxylase
VDLPDFNAAPAPELTPALLACCDVLAGEAPGTEAGWSQQEQSGVDRDADTLRALTEGNRAYEERFGQVFLICATGLSSEEVLGSLHRRLGSDEQTEAGVVADELRKIALLRLGRVVTP